MIDIVTAPAYNTIDGTLVNGIRFTEKGYHQPHQKAGLCVGRVSGSFSGGLFCLCRFCLGTELHGPRVRFLSSNAEP
jgi:hypothetical protein